MRSAGAERRHGAFLPPDLCCGPKNEIRDTVAFREALMKLNSLELFNIFLLHTVVGTVRGVASHHTGSAELLVVTSLAGLRSTARLRYYSSEYVPLGGAKQE